MLDFIIHNARQDTDAIVESMILRTHKSKVKLKFIHIPIQDDSVFDDVGRIGVNHKNGVFDQSVKHLPPFEVMRAIDEQTNTQLLSF